MAQNQSRGRKRSYRFELRLARNGSVYLTAKEFRVRNGKIKTNWIMLFEEDLPALVRSILQLNDLLGLGVEAAEDGPAIQIVDFRDGFKADDEPKSKSYSLDEIRQIFPRHGEPWDLEEEERLAEKFGEGVSIESLAEFHERKPTAIASRLKKLGLIEDEKDVSSESRRLTEPTSPTTAKS